uniref:Uncharacterized protein n=1 Tax=Mycena chlorophos TaxID=658473 RepID=A0ABQ0M7F1_MYCCL|nr:predicted protein [Mycena chlorophos]
MDEIRQRYLTSSQYTASPKVGQGQFWKRKDSGHAVCCRQNGEVVIQVFTVVGKISEANLFVDGLGGWSPTWERTPMEKAKYQFQMERPEGSVFAADWDVAVKNLEKFQVLMAKSGRAENFVVSTISSFHPACIRKEDT